HKDADGGATSGGIGIAPDAELRQGVGDQQFQKKRNNIRNDGADVLSLLNGYVFERHPRLVEEHTVPERSQNPIGDSRDNDGGVVCAHGKSSDEWAESVSDKGLSQVLCMRDIRYHGQRSGTAEGGVQLPFRARRLMEIAEFGYQNQEPVKARCPAMSTGDRQLITDS